MKTKKKIESCKTSVFASLFYVPKVTSLYTGAETEDVNLKVFYCKH